MKRLVKNLSVVLVIAIFSCSLFACSNNQNSSASTGSLSGYWACDSMSYSGETMTSSDMESLLGTSAADFMCMEIKEDHTANISLMGENVQGEWQESGNDISITVEGEAMTFVREGDSLKCDMGEDMYLYMKQVSEKPSALN